MPTRNARNGLLHTSRGPVVLKNARWKLCRGAARPGLRLPDLPALLAGLPAPPLPRARGRGCGAGDRPQPALLPLLDATGAVGYHVRPLRRGPRGGSRGGEPRAAEEGTYMDAKNPLMSVSALHPHLRDLLPAAHHADAPPAEEAPGAARQAHQGRPRDYQRRDLRHGGGDRGRQAHTPHRGTEGRHSGGPLRRRRTRQGCWDASTSAPASPSREVACNAS